MSQRKRKRWDAAEEEELRRAVTHHGVGKWAKMLNDSNFSFSPGRTNVDLKDKWRNMSDDDLKDIPFPKCIEPTMQPPAASLVTEVKREVKEETDVAKDVEYRGYRPGSTKPEVRVKNEPGVKREQT